MSNRAQFWTVICVGLVLLYPGLLILIPAVAIPFAILIGIAWTLWITLKGLASWTAQRHQAARSRREVAAMERRWKQQEAARSTPLPSLTRAEKAAELSRQLSESLQIIADSGLPEEQKEGLRNAAQYEHLKQLRRLL